jgi:hypothetical protein
MAQDTTVCYSFQQWPQDIQLKKKIRTFSSSTQSLKLTHYTTKNGGDIAKDWL